MYGSQSICSFSPKLSARINGQNLNLTAWTSAGGGAVSPHGTGIIRPDGTVEVKTKEGSPEGILTWKDLFRENGGCGRVENR